MKKNILLLLSIISIIIIILNNSFGISHTIMVVNIFVILSFIILIVLDIMTFKIISNKIIKIVHIIITILMALLLMHKIFVSTVLFIVGGPEKTINLYNPPSNSKESLRNVYYADMTYMTPPIQVVYEKIFIFGIKCSVIIKSNSENIESFNLKEIFQKELAGKSNGFCNYNLKIE